MPRMILALSTAFFLALAGLALADDAAAAARAKEAEQLLRSLHAGKVDGFFARCTAEMQAAIPLEKFKAIVAQFGALETLSPRGEEGGASIFRARFASGDFNCFVTLNSKNQVAGLWYKPAPAEGAIPNADHATKTRLSLPFRGAWTVGNGGRDSARNNHIGNAQQSFAYDFTRDHKGEGKRLEDYEAFGAEVLAPADGVVVQTIDGSIDLAPGEHDPYVIPGNMVVIDFGSSEFGFFCHFQRGSIQVKPGQKVARGDPLGLCGNTGNTSEPHIHFHLQDNAVLHRGQGIPAPFSDVLVDGKKVGSAEPSRGQKVENAEAGK